MLLKDLFAIFDNENEIILEVFYFEQFAFKAQQRYVSASLKSAGYGTERPAEDNEFGKQLWMYAQNRFEIMTMMEAMTKLQKSMQTYNNGTVIYG